MGQLLNKQVDDALAPEGRAPLTLVPPPTTGPAVRPPWLDTRTWVEKGGWLVLVLGWALIGYYSIALGQDPTSPQIAQNTALLAIALDHWVPFEPLSQYVYAAIYTSMLIPMLVVHDRRLFARVSISYLAVLCTSFAVYLLFPATTQGFRPAISALDTEGLTGWGIAVNYHFDLPLNCFPSLHVGAAFAAGLAAWKVDRRSGSIALALATAIGISTLFVKQHYLLDVVGGIVNAAVWWALIVRPYRRPDFPTLAEVRGARVGMGVYALVYVGFVLALAALWWAGVQPWR